MKNINDLSNIIVDYIENNKMEFNIDYENSIQTIQELLDEIKREYDELGVGENEN